MLRTEDWSIARDSTLEYGELSSGGSRIKSDIRTYLKGNNSTLDQNIAVNCETTRVDDHHIEIHHQSGYSSSSLSVKSACADKGHAIGTGLLAIEEDCDKTDAGQVFKNLLLSPQAKAESIPELEVLSDDVSAAHGAASSSIEPEQIHYMMARGYTPEDAQAAIVEGFLISSFAKMKNDTTRQFLLDALSKQTHEWVKGVREDFPILQREINGYPLVYFDNAATTQKPNSVIDAMNDYYSNSNANVHRAVHTLAGEATEGYESCRLALKARFNANRAIITSGTTEAINLVAHAWGRANLSDGDAVILTEMEHHSDIVPWQMLAQEMNIELRYVPVQKDLTLDMDLFEAAIDGAKLVCVVHISNLSLIHISEPTRP